MAANRICPICYQIPEQEIYQCSAGHIICSKCIVTLSICPQCRVAFDATKIRCLGLENILDAEEFECPFKEGGCELKCKRAYISKHAKSCDFNPDLVFLCKMIGFKNCKFALGSSSKSREEILAHFQTAHGCGMAEMTQYNNVEVLLDLAALSGDDAKFLLPMIFSQADETSDLFLLVGKINQPRGFVSEICIQIWGQEEPIRQRYNAMFSICKDPSQNNNGGACFCNYNRLGLDRFRVDWILNVCTVAEAKYMLKTSPINIPVSFLADLLTSRNTGTVLKVKVSPGY